MPYAVALALAILLAPVQAGQVWAAPSHAESYDAELDAFIKETVEAANAYFGGATSSLGRPYRPPRLVTAGYDQRIRSVCGNSRGSDHSYCPDEETVYLDYDSDDESSFASLWDDERLFVIVLTIGHEWGHHVQRLLGRLDIFDDESLSEDEFSRRSIEVELQADCMMGAFARAYARASEWVERADLKDAIEDTHDSGLDEDTPVSERTHGTPDQRVAAFLRGYHGDGLRSCGV